MRHSINVAVALLIAAGGMAQAQEPLDPYGMVQVQSPPPPPVPSPYYAPAPSYYYPPQVTGYYYVQPAPIYMVPVAPRRPVYVIPVVTCPTSCPCGVTCPVYTPPLAYNPPVVAAVAPPKALPHARFFSIGGRFVGYGVNQSINGQNTILWGGGLQARFRTRGRFGLELAVDFLTGSFGASSSATPITVLDNQSAAGFQVGRVSRDSIPTTLSLMAYIFPNDDERHFNMYFFGGGGIVGTTMTLTDSMGDKTKQDFLEYEVHGGLGLELRFKWFAIEANIRALGLFREDSYGAARFYKDVSNGPVAKSSWGGQGTLGAAFWF